LAVLSAGRAVRLLKTRGTKSATPVTQQGTSDAVLPPPEERGGTLSPGQIRYFETFGFLVLPGLFAADVDRLVTGFEEVFANHQRWETHERLHFNETRMIIPSFVKKSPLLVDLPTDPRVVGVVQSLLGENFIDTESDGNLFSCDTCWHPDTYSAPLTDHHVKLSFYLDDLSGQSGAIRMMPGTNHFKDDYPKTLRRELDDPDRIESLFGMAPEDLPSHIIESTPGDVVIWDFRTIHASFNGGARRRLFSLNFRQLPEPDGKA
jgi:ectoine hydroxylase-related dioxygenase (phytanoyl-CoA dioxygenase family)